jgi:RNA polymerase sigma-70 factor (ECF subfamily)
MGENTDKTKAGGPHQGALAEQDLANHIPVIRNYIRKIVRKDEVEDGVQTVLARALENLDRYRGESTPRVWLLGIARNVGYELARARQRRPLLVGGHGADSDEPGNQEIAISTNEPTVEDLLGRKEQQALALAALDGLGLDDKLALLVTYVDNLPGPDAAELLGVSFAAFRQRLSRARQAMARELERVMKSGTPGSPEVLAQWQTLLHPQKKRASDPSIETGDLIGSDEDSSAS